MTSSIYRNKIEFTNWSVFQQGEKQKEARLRRVEERKLIRFFNRLRQTLFLFRLVLATLISFARQFYRKKKKAMIIHTFNNDARKLNPLIALVLFCLFAILRALVASIFFIKDSSLCNNFSFHEAL